MKVWNGSVGGIAMVLVLAVVLVVGGGCSCIGNGGTRTEISLVSPSDGSDVYGIVKLNWEAQAKGGIGSVKVYWDFRDEDHLIGTVMRPGVSELSQSWSWRTTDVQNGEHVLYAVVSDTGGKNSYQTSATVIVANKTRADVIPKFPTKMTPQTDLHPPILNPALSTYWMDPVPLGSPINTAGDEDSPFITPDGESFYFFFTPNVKLLPNEQIFDRVTGIYWSHIANGQWAEPQRVFLNYYDEQALDGAPTLRGETLWFCSARSGNYRGVDMWTAQLEDGTWTKWTNAGEKLNKDYQIGELHVSTDGNEIYFDSTSEGGKGQKDIWVTRKVEGEWQEPENIAAVNTADGEGWPFLSEDGTELWFTRTVGSPAIYRSRKIDGQWQTPELILSTFAAEPTLDSQGNIYFAHHYWDDSSNSMIESDIYVCYRR